MTFSRRALSAMLFSALALPAMAQGMAHSHRLVPAKTGHTHPVAATTPVPYTTTTHLSTDAAPTRATTPPTAPATTVTTPTAPMAGPAPTKPATVKPN